MSETLTYRPDDFDGAKAVRIRVFMEEQGFKNEFDGVDQDPRTLEVAVRDAEDNPVGCARVFPSKLEPGIGTEEGRWVFGRLAVVPEHRHGGLGSKILAYSEEETRMRGAREMHLHAQLSVMPFYARAGYEPYGPVELDEHVEHRWMRKRLG